MVQSQSDKQQHAKNPVIKYLAVTSIGTLCFVGLTAFFKWEESLAMFVKPLILACSVLVMAYTLWAVRLGVVSTIGQRGQVYYYSRKKEPILFFLLVITYLVLATANFLYVSSLLLWP
ncbi:MAG: hypothetical protein KDD55_04530 [Bdellovibrionales bacterium]|nr:hypothetical protein [Bdellovibrionales bacterium]